MTIAETAPTYRCAGPNCQGLPWKASDMPHPVSCAASPTGTEKPHLFITAKEYAVMSIDEIEAKHVATTMTFSLNSAETAKATAWCDEHNKKHPGTGASGGRYTFSFTPTTLGTVAEVTCACGESVDLTDYEEW